MSLGKDLLSLCLDVYEARMDANEHLPIDERRRLARAAAERVDASGAPAAVAWIERQRAPRDQLADRRLREKARRLRERARPFVDAALREANADGDLSEAQLVGSGDRKPSAWPNAVRARDRLCWELARVAGMRTREIALVVRLAHGRVAVAIKRHDVALAAARGKEMRAHGA